MKRPKQPTFADLLAADPTLAARVKVCPSSQVVERCQKKGLPVPEPKPATPAPAPSRSAS